VSIQLLDAAAAALGPLLDDVVFLGGASIVLWITDPGAPPPRPTKDVDVVVEVTTRADLEDFERRLSARGFREDMDSRVICRWRHPDGPADEPLILDAMPAEARLLGFENRWQAKAVPHAQLIELPSGAMIRAIPPPYLVATKLEAFRRRGAGDHLGSRDLEDVVTLVDGRDELVAEIATSSTDVRRYVCDEIGMLLDESRFVDAILGFLRTDIASQERAGMVILPRLRQIVDRP
jgi:hypothetical protein